MTLGRTLRSAARWALLALVVVFAPFAHAHEARPAYLQLTETGPGRYDVVWRTPLLSGMRLPVVVRFPEGTRALTGPNERDFNDSIVERRTIEIDGGLEGKSVEFVGLQATITDVLARVQTRDGRMSMTLVQPSSPRLEVTAPQGTLAVFATYVRHGVEHILLGIDHLLFVFGLLLIVRTPWMLVKAITAFTVAHSITLAVATLGYAHIPAPPLNAAIALSILFLGPEIVRVWRGETSFTIRHPWIVAFAFGLLHGFGFASGLTALGLPQGDIPLALFAFNVGVEIGQLAFVALILLTVRAFKVLELHWSKAMQLAPGYVVGTFGAFWTIQRVVMMIEGG
ncbi:MAG: HupE/UreJ family protein [Burkholderiales bacterium]|nr:HupE/UreJ family protein [Burkholderiales bacterium]